MDQIIMESTSINPVTEMTTDKSGSVLPKPEYLWLYLVCYFSFLLFFTLLGAFNSFFIPWIAPGKYEKKTLMEQKYFTSLFVSATHHVIISTYVIWIYCNSQCEGAYPFIWFFDEVCQLEFDSNFIYAGMITASYLTYDYVYQRYRVNDKESQVARSMLWHHIIGAGGILLGIGSGFVAPGVCSVTLLSEFCSIFLIFREMQEDKFSPHPLSMLN